LNERFDLPVSEIAETDALGGCCSKYKKNTDQEKGLFIFFRNLPFENVGINEARTK